VRCITSGLWLATHSNPIGANIRQIWMAWGNMQRTLNRPASWSVVTTCAADLMHGARFNICTCQVLPTFGQKQTKKAVERLWTLRQLTYCYPHKSLVVPSAINDFFNLSGAFILLRHMMRSMTFITCLYYGQDYIGPRKGLLVVNPITPATLQSSIVSMPRSSMVLESIRTHAPSWNNWSKRFW
jgi:hypothetical protein